MFKGSDRVSFVSVACLVLFLYIRYKTVKSRGYPSHKAEKVAAWQFDVTFCSPIPCATSKCFPSVVFIHSKLVFALKVFLVLHWKLVKGLISQNQHLFSIYSVFVWIYWNSIHFWQLFLWDILFFDFIKWHLPYLGVGSYFYIFPSFTGGSKIWIRNFEFHNKHPKSLETTFLNGILVT